MHTIEILAMGAQLRREAEKRCANVNEAHFLVHEVMSDAFVGDPSLLAPGALADELSARLDDKLEDCKPPRILAL